MSLTHRSANLVEKKSLSKDLIVNNDVVTQQVLTMIKTVNNQEFTNMEVALWMEAFERFQITEQEAIDAFWDAFADPYKSGNKIQFSHLWKSVKENRDKKPENQKLWVYEEALQESQRAHLQITDLFTCLNGENGTERVLLSSGKPAWVKK